MPRSSSSLSATATAALALLLGSIVPASAHMIMATPKPFGNPDNSPLSSSGSNYPCKLTGDPATFYTGAATTMAVGEKQKLTFTGSAVHGGGSCQLAVTSDKQPSPSTAWQVILSIEGGCPSTTGDGPSEYEYTIPDSVAPGDYVFAWTWISKLAGQPEYYMNCAPIQVTGGKTKRDSREIAALAERDALPNLFVANLASINSCKAGPSVDVVYPDPGPNLIKPRQPASAFLPGNPTGTNCFPIGGTGGASNSSAGAGSGSGSGSGAGSGSGSFSSAAAAAPPASTGSAGTFASSSGAAAAGSAPASTSASAVATTPSAAAGTAAAAAPPSGNSSASLVVSPITASTTAPAAASSPPTPSSSGSAGTPPASGSGGAGSGLSGPCTSEGTFNCIGGSQYQQCASGAWTALRPMPAGTTCAIGQSTTLWAQKQKMVKARGEAAEAAEPARGRSWLRRSFGGKVRFLE